MAVCNGITDICEWSTERGGEGEDSSGIGPDPSVVHYCPGSNISSVQDWPCWEIVVCRGGHT